MDDDGEEDDEEDDDEDDQASESPLHKYLREVSRDEDTPCEVSSFHLEDWDECQGNYHKELEKYLGMTSKPNRLVPDGFYCSKQ